MCGIAGIATFKDNLIHLPVAVAAMSAKLKHRGPDDEGFVFFGPGKTCIAGSNDTQPSAWNSPFSYSPKEHIRSTNDNYNIALAHRRLSVIDLSEAGHQPMCNEDGSVWIICNGEIYNYIELREELKQQGVQFKTASDIEVLLKSYEHWGIRCLDHLNGMWAFVIYDRKQNLLIGARDRFGVKPLYYYNSPDFFAFASEQKALLEIPGLKTGVISEAVYEHLLLGQVELREEGFFRNIYELLPGHCFELNLQDGVFNTRKYYHLTSFCGINTYNSEQQNSYVESVREKIFHAVDIRLRSDVPVGFCLSGGLDSSSIVCISEQIRSERTMAQLSDRLHTFTAVNTGGKYDESAWAEKVAIAANTEWTKADCNAADILPFLESMIYHQDVPLFSTSTFAQNRVMKAAHEKGIKILLDGQGGDELFAGYQTFYTSMLLDYLRKFSLKDFFREFSSLGNSASSAGIFGRSLMKLSLDGMLTAGMKNSIASLYRPELAYFSKESRKLNAGLLNLSGEFSSKPLNELLHYYFTGYYLKNLLRWEDRCSMQYSVESRTPFSDDIDLIEFVFSIPAAYKIRSGWSKNLMRKAMKGILPEEIRTRRDKLGFATPQTEWLMQINASMKTRILELKELDDTGIVNQQKLFKDWEVIFSNPSLSKAQDFVWRYLNFLIWKQIFF
jgi:asparagine synthase (glutamine-hydrolysing)